MVNRWWERLSSRLFKHVRMLRNDLEQGARSTGGRAAALLPLLQCAPGNAEQFRKLRLRKIGSEARFHDLGYRKTTVLILHTGAANPAFAKICCSRQKLGIQITLRIAGQQLLFSQFGYGRSTPSTSSTF